MNDEITDWLLKSDPWTEYRTRIDLLDQPGDSEEVIASFNRMVHHPKIISILDELANWPGVVLNGHKNAGLLYHRYFI